MTASGRAQVSAHPVIALAPELKASAVAGYVWSEGDAYYAYNSAGGTVTITPNTPVPGVYAVLFAGLQAIGDTGTAQVTAYRNTDTCVILGWSNTSSGELADVSCYTPAGVLDTSGVEFDLTISKQVKKPSGVFDYAWIHQTGISANLTGLGQYNSARKVNRQRHLGTGRYQIVFPGPKSSGEHGTVEVTPFDTDGGDCVLAGWHGTSRGQDVNVDCYSAAGARRNLAFTVVYASTNNVLGLNGVVDANALFSGRHGVTKPVEDYFSAKHAKAVSDEVSTGSYTVTLRRSGGDFVENGGDVQVSAVSSHDYRCEAVEWDTEAIPVVHVSCFNDAGNPVSTPYVLQWVNL